MRYVAIVSVIAIGTLALLAVALAGESLRAFLEASFAFGAAAFDVVLLYLRLCGVLLVFLIMAAVLYVFRRQSMEHKRQRDGAFAQREIWLQPPWVRWLNTLRGQISARVILDANAMISHAVIVGAFGVREVEPAAGYDAQLQHRRELEKTRRVQAAVVGDAVYASPLSNVPARVGGIANAATGKYLAGGWDKDPKRAVIDQLPAQSEPPQLPAPGPLTIREAAAQSGPEQWHVGYAADGSLATFAPLRHSHAAVVGSPGTGKTTSVGYMLTCYALNYGWRVVILDGDNGAAWQPFAPYAEHVASEPDTLPGQVDALLAEFQRRSNLLRAGGVDDVALLPQAAQPPRLLCVVEEFGDLIHTLRLRNKVTADQVDAQLDTILRRGRKTGMHMMVLDQYPEYWSQQLIAATKWRAVFQLGPGQGSKMEEYAAASLPPRGEFLLRRVQYTALHAKPMLRQLLASVPALPASARLLSGPAASQETTGAGVSQSVSGDVFPGVLPGVALEVAPPPPMPGNTGNTPVPAPDPGRWYEYIFAHMQTPAGAGLWQSPARGVRDLARHLSKTETGSEAAEDNYAGMISKLAARIRSEHQPPSAQPSAHPTEPPSRIDLSTEEGRAAFARFAADATLPGGAPLGTDITTGGA